MGIKAEQNALKQLMGLNCVVEVDCMRQNDCEHNPLRERCETLAEFGDDGCVIRNAMRILKRSIRRGKKKEELLKTEVERLKDLSDAKDLIIRKANAESLDYARKLKILAGQKVEEKKA